jgi:hypothetical protein
MPRFEGVPFGPHHPFNQQEAQYVLGQLMGEFRPLLSTSSKHAPLFDAEATKEITGAWDSIPMKTYPSEDFNRHPHLTIAFEPTWVQIQITLGNATDKRCWERLLRSSDEELKLTLEDVAKPVQAIRQDLPLGKRDPRVWIRLEQRHFHAQRFNIDDGRLVFDFDSLGLGNPDPRIKVVAGWLPALRALLRTQESANYQFQIQTRFTYGPGTRCSQSIFPHLLVEVAESFLPFMSLVMGGVSPNGINLRA